MFGTYGRGEWFCTEDRVLYKYGSLISSLVQGKISHNINTSLLNLLKLFRSSQVN